MKRTNVPIWFHENVLQQKRTVFEMLFQPAKYRLFDFEVSPEAMGFALVERRRRYIMGVNLERAAIIADPHAVLQMVCAQLQAVRTRPEHALMASLAEVIEEATALCMKRGISVPQQIACCSSLSMLDLTELLTPREQESLHDFTAAYVKKRGCLPCCDANAFFFLGDNASNRLTWSCGTGKLPTMRCTRGKYWSPMARRWLTARELLACMGFPTYPILARNMGVAEMAFDSATSAQSFLGNAMHASVAGVLLTTCLTCVRLL